MCAVQSPALFLTLFGSGMQIAHGKARISYTFVSCQKDPFNNSFQSSRMKLFMNSDGHFKVSHQTLKKGSQCSFAHNSSGFMVESEESAFVFFKRNLHQMSRGLVTDEHSFNGFLLLSSPTFSFFFSFFFVFFCQRLFAASLNDA